MEISPTKMKDMQHTLVSTPGMPATDAHTAHAATQATAHTRPGYCPNCGAKNDPEALFCENCGAVLRQCLCPECGQEVEAGTDFCEVCGSYIAQDRCAFCSAPMSPADDICPECKAPRTGIECPTCQRISKFAFCTCGTPLTDRARQELQRAWDIPERQQVIELCEELERLWMTLPTGSGKYRSARQKNEQLRSRVMELLQQDGGFIYADTARQPEPALDNDELLDCIQDRQQQLQQLLDRMTMPEQRTPAEGRIKSMARKPAISKLGWRCNYKNALHTSPLGCACPQQGGKWIVLGKDNLGQVQDDK